MILCAACASLSPLAQAQFAEGELPLGIPGLEEVREERELGPGVLYTRIARAGVGGPAQALLDQFPSDSGGPPAAGPWVIHVVEIAPDAPYELDLVAGQDSTAGRENTTDITLRKGALLGVNGGYFVTNEGDGITGEPAGIGVYDGILTSEAVQGRANFVLNGAQVADSSIEELWTELALVDEASWEQFLVDGVNRKHGLIRMCGGVGGDTPGPENSTGLGLPAPAFFLDGGLPYHDWTCVDDSELIVYNDRLGTHLPPAEFEARVAADGLVLSSGPWTDAPVEPGTWAVTATGAEPVAWLQARATVGSKLRYTQRLLKMDGSELPLNPELEITNGGPRLLRDGAVAIDSVGEGFSAVHPLPGFGVFYSETAQPRLLAGKKADNSLLLVLADGRRADYSQGLAIREAAEVMLALGAVDAINLDGGGSATMSDAHGELMNRVSGGGERDVMDALVLVPKGQAAKGEELRAGAGSALLLAMLALCLVLRRAGRHRAVVG